MSQIQTVRPEPRELNSIFRKIVEEFRRGVVDKINIVKTVREWRDRSGRRSWSYKVSITVYGDRPITYEIEPDSGADVDHLMDMLSTLINRLKRISIDMAIEYYRRKYGDIDVNKNILYFKGSWFNGKVYYVEGDECIESVRVSDVFVYEDLDKRDEYYQFEKPFPLKEC